MTDGTGNYPVKLALFFRFAIVITLCALALFALVLVSNRETSSVAPTATRRLHLNDMIAADDIETAQTKALLGRFMLRTVDPGQRITVAMTSEREIPPRKPNMIAVVVTVPAKSHAGLSRDQDVVLTGKDAKPLATGTIADIDCENGTCLLVVDLHSRPDFEPDALVGADVRPLDLQVQ